MTLKTNPLRSLVELKAVKKQIETSTAALAAQRVEQARRQAKESVEANLFKHAAGQVQALRVPARADTKPPAPAALPRQRVRDDQAVLQESLSDEFDVGSLLETDEQLSYRQTGIGADVLKKLRKGHWSIQAQLDLHGLRSDDARLALSEFIRTTRAQGLRCVRVVHGKGLGSPGKTPVLKGRVQGWLVQKKEVLAFVQARPAEGGAGALVVLLTGI